MLDSILTAMPYYLYKFLGSLTEPMNLFAVLLFIGAFLAILPWEGGARFGRRLCFLFALLLVTMIFVPLGQWALMPLENRYTASYPDKIDGIVVLTGDESPSLSEARGQPIVGFAAQRELFLVRLLKRYPQAKTVIVGRTEPFFKSEKTTTQSIIQQSLEGIGIPRDRIQYEPASRTTHENAAETKKLLQPKAEQTWLLLTSAYHMPRSVACFQKEGFHVVPVPTDYLTLPTLGGVHALNLETQIRYVSLAAHEYVGLLSYWLAGWIDRPWK